MLFRAIAVIMLVSTTVGCGQFGVAGPEDLGLEAKLRTGPVDLLVVSDNRLDDFTVDPGYKKTLRNEILSRWLLRSDHICGIYQLQLSRLIRDTRLGTDLLATVLSGLATILAPPATKTALAGAATITLGVGGNIQTDLFMQQAGEVVGTAIQAVRTRARNELEKKFQAEYVRYTLAQGLVDVERYDRETCNLNVGLNEIRASLNLGGTAASQLNNPIVPLPPAPPPGAVIAEAAPPPAAMATTIIPPTTSNIPGGGVAIIPGKVISTPVAPPVVTPPPPPVVLAPAPLPPVSMPPPPPVRPSAERPRGPGAGAQAPAQACKESGPVFPMMCPPLSPQLSEHRKKVSDTVRGLRDINLLETVAARLDVPTPVRTVKCMQQDIVQHISQICTDEKMKELDSKLADVIR